MASAMLFAYEKGKRRDELVSVAVRNFKCLWKQINYNSCGTKVLGLESKRKKQTLFHDVVPNKSAFPKASFRRDDWLQP